MTVRFDVSPTQPTGSALYPGIITDAAGAPAPRPPSWLESIAPLLGHIAARVSGSAFLISVATVILSLPDGLLARHFPAPAVTDLLDGAQVIAAITGAHGFVARSVLKPAPPDPNPSAK